MAERVVKIRYDVLVDGAVANVKKLKHATDDYATKGAERVRKNEQSWRSLSTGLAVGAAATGAALAVVTKRWMGFEQAMSGVEAVAGATQEQMGQLEEAAIKLGASTVFSASEVAEAQGELVRAGVSVEDMLNGGLNGALDLAAAGNLGLADAAVISAQAMNLFNLEGSDVTHIADVLASGANKSAADVADLGQAMQQAGTVASQTGLSLEETTAALSMFADQGIRGSDAGTSLKTMLQRLTPQSKEAQRVMDELGFSAFDASGEFIGLEGLAGELQESFGGLDTQSRQAALGVAFGSDAIRGASILMEGGATAAREYEAAMNDSGAAARMAATMTDNLAGDVEELGGALETAFIRGGSVANDTLRGVVQGLTGLVNMAADVPRPVQEVGIALAGIGTVGGLATAGVVKLGVGLVSLSDDMVAVAGKSTRVTSALGKVGGVLAGPWGIAIAAGATLLGAYAIKQGEARARVDELKDSLDAQTGSITAATTALQVQELSQDGHLEYYESIGGNVEDLTAALEGEAGARARVTELLDAQTKSVQTVNGVSIRQADEARKLQQVMNRMNAETEDAIEKARREAEANGEVLRTKEQLNVETRRLAGQAEAYAAQQTRVNEATELWMPKAERMVAEAEDGAQAYADWAAEMGGFSAAFVSGSDALASVNEATREWAEAQADATEAADDSWEDFWDGQSVNVDEWISELERQQEAQAAWEENMVRLAGMASQGVVDEFARMGPEAAVLLQGVLDEGESAMSRLEPVLGDGARAGSAAFADGMGDAGPIIRAAAARWGQDVADEIAAKLASGEATAAEIVAAYDLAATINLQADPAAYDDTLNASLALGNESYATPKILGDAAPFGAELSAALGKADASTGTPDINGDAARFGRELGDALGLANRSTGTPDIDADDWLFQRRLSDALRDADRSTGTPDIDADDSDGRRVLNSFIRKVNYSNGTVDVDADTRDADDAMYGFFRRHDGKTIKVGMDASFNSGGGYADGAFVEYADGGIDDQGRYVPRQSMMGGPAYGRTNIRWGEPETGWEAYISGKPSMRARNIGILEEAAHRLGMTVLEGLPGTQYANGGFASPMDLTMDTTLSNTSRWQDALEGAASKWLMSSGGGGGVNYGGAYGWAPGGGQPWQRTWALIKMLVPNAILTSAYRPGAVTASGVPSLHGQGRAVDWVVPGMGEAMRQAFLLVGKAGRWSQHFYSGAPRSAQEGYYDQTIYNTHHDHGHTALDKGGIIEALRKPLMADTGYTTLKPGWNVRYNGLGRDEHMLDVRHIARDARQAPPPVDLGPLAARLDHVAARVDALGARIDQDNRAALRGHLQDMVTAGRRG